MRGLHSGQGVRSVVYLTEQQPSSFRASLARAALLDQEDLAVIFWHEAMALSWPRVVAAAAKICRARSARLLVVDTLSQWAGMRGDMENQAGDAFAALQPLQQLAASGVAVVFLQHERKSGGDAADAGRGSSAFAGAVDTLVSFRRPPYVTSSSSAVVSPFPRGEGGQGVRSLRLLLALSRFEAVPPELYVERLNGRYAIVGQTSDFAAQQARSAILAALHPLPELGEGRGEGLPSSLDGERPEMRGISPSPLMVSLSNQGKGPGDRSAITLDDLIHTTGIGRMAARRAIEALLAAGEIRRIGTGKRASPYHYAWMNSFPVAIE